MFVGPPRRGGGQSANWLRPVDRERPFGEPQSSEEPRDLELRRAHERGRGRYATHPLQIPWKGWYDILWRTYREMNSDRLLSIAGGVSFFVLLAIFPAITALVSAYGLFFNASTITNNLSLLNEVVPGNVLGIVHEQASRIASNSGGALSIGIVVGANDVSRQVGAAELTARPRANPKASRTKARAAAAMAPAMIGPH
jgi:Virulence factor BrkB